MTLLVAIDLRERKIRPKFPCKLIQRATFFRPETCSSLKFEGVTRTLQHSSYHCLWARLSYLVSMKRLNEAPKEQLLLRRFNSQNRICSHSGFSAHWSQHSKKEEKQRWLVWGSVGLGRESLSPKPRRLEQFEKLSKREKT